MPWWYSWRWQRMSRYAAFPRLPLHSSPPSLPSIPPLILPSHPFPPLHPSPYPSIPPFPSPPSHPLSFHPTLSLPSIPPLILPSHPFPPLHLSPYPFIPPLPSPPFQLPSLTFLSLYPCYSSFIFPLMPFFFHPYLLPSCLSPSPSLTSISSLSVSPFITHACLHPWPLSPSVHLSLHPSASPFVNSTSKWCIFLPHLAIASSPPIFEDFPPSRKEANAEDVISLPCRSKPPRVYPTVRDWRKDGKPLLEEDTTSNRITSSGGQLLIKSATREDSGNYTCSLVNSAGNVTSNSSQVIVKGKSHFTDWYLFVYTKGFYFRHG